MYQLNVIDGGERSFDALLYKPPPPSLMEYINSNLQEVVDYGKSLGDRFVNTVKEMYNSVHSEEARRSSKLALQHAGVHLSEFVILPYEYSNMNSVNLGMQHYIMCNPVIANHFERDLCYGFADTYLSLEPNTYGKDTLAYGQVMDGVLTFEDNVDTGVVYTYSQLDDHLGGDLDLIDKISVLRTWDHALAMLEAGYDPTDPTLENL